MRSKGYIALPGSFHDQGRKRSDKGWYYGKGHKVVRKPHQKIVPSDRRNFLCNVHGHCVEFFVPSTKPATRHATRVDKDSHSGNFDHGLLHDSGHGSPNPYSIQFGICIGIHTATKEHSNNSGCNKPRPIKDVFVVMWINSRLGYGRWCQIRS